MYYEIHGRTDGAPTVVLSSGLGGAAHYWAPQIPVLAQHFRVIAYDQQGTGRSGGAVPEGYSIGDMANELAALLDELGVSRCHFIGHALGGLIGLRLALDRPSMIDRMVLVNAWAKTHPHTLRCFAIRKSLLLDTGPEAYVRAQPLFLYPATWLADRQDWLLEQDAAGIAHFPPTETVLRRIGAVEAFEIGVSTIVAPTMVIATRDDVLVPYSCSIELADGLPNAELTLIDHGGHACNITDAAGFDAMVLRFLLER
ncbi:MAG TPA: pyrimidine utilization protein D [Acetobacteraceae bacterium]|nr:pyrimidine utilization protein D [Acetobacteraceae bacterium]